MKKLSALLLLLTGCLKQVPEHENQFESLVYDTSYTNGISWQDREKYYHTSQGIYYVPYDIISTLSRPASSEFRLYDELFFEDPERLGLIPNPFKSTNPPIGITVSHENEFLPMFGISCSTCHTSVIAKNDTAILIDGSGSKFAIERLIKEMVSSLALTIVDPVEFNKFYDRFLDRVKLKEYPNSSFEFDLMMYSDSYKEIKNSIKTQDFNDLAPKLSDFEANVLNEIGSDRVPTTLRFNAYPTFDDVNTRSKMFLYLSNRLLWFIEQAGYSKADERFASSGLGRGSPWGSSINMFASVWFNKSSDEWPSVSSGSIDTPYIWKYDDAKWIFATGSTNSMTERNLIQSISLMAPFNPKTFEVSVTIKKLELVQQSTRKFVPPSWPAFLGPINQQKADNGKVLFKHICLNCHNPKRDTFNGPGSIEYNFYDVGTDDTYYKAQTQDFYGKVFVNDVLAGVMKKVKKAAQENEGITDLAPFEIGRENVVWKEPNGNKIVAKPLWGVWATAPYLHNGSVLNMKELLTVPENRVTAFHVGSIQFDSVNLGFENKQTAYSNLFETNCDKCLGNSNAGHNYGTSLSEEGKMELIEFLKTYNMDTEFK